MPLKAILPSLILLLSTLAHAVPQFDGIQRAYPAPREVFLTWNRSSDDNKSGSVDYVVYMNDGSGWQLDRPVMSVNSTEAVIPNLTPGKSYEFLVRAKDSSGADSNKKIAKATPTGQYPSEEFRAAWISRFEWGGSSKSQVQSFIAGALNTLSKANMNAVVLQVRGQGDTFYPSKEEPWSPILRGDAKSFDPVAYALQEARKNNIELHAWMNLSVIWQSGKKVKPTDRNHPYYKFVEGPNASGVIHDASGKPHIWGDSGYVWLTHGNPKVNTYLRRQVMNFLDVYPVDGLHWDDRTGNPNGVSKDPVSQARFNGRGNPNKVRSLKEWQDEQLTRFLMNVYVSAKAKRPDLLITASPFGIADRRRISGYGRFSDAAQFGVEPERWLSMGVLDALIPQVYWGLEDPEPNYGTLILDWHEENESGRPIWPGSAFTRYGNDLQPLKTHQSAYVAMTRALGMGGNCFYNFSGAPKNEWLTDTRTFYPNKATVPVPDHMKGDQRGHIMGTVVDRSGKPILDCWIAINGRKFIYTTALDGFYAIPNVPAGEHQVSFASKQGEHIKRTVKVSSGRVSNLDLQVP